jgi:hypothetical protein
VSAKSRITCRNVDLEPLRVVLAIAGTCIIAGVASVDRCARRPNQPKARQILC